MSQHENKTKDMKWVAYPAMEVIKYAAPQISTSGYVYIASSNCKEGLYSYNLSKNTWRLVWKYPLAFEPLRHTVLVDNDTSKIYIYSTAASVYDCFYEIDPKTKSHFCYRGMAHGLPERLGNASGGYAEMVQMNGTIHVVGGYNSCYHSVWQKITDTELELNINAFKQYPISNRSEKTSLYGHALIAMESKQRLLIFGGNSSMMFGGHLKDIWVCDVQTMTWDKLQDVTMPYKMFNFGYITTNDERFGNKFICFGGKTNTGLINEIWILDLNEWKWTKSEVKCPKNAMFYGIKTQFNEVVLFEMNKSCHWKMKLSEIIKIDQKTVDLNIISSLKAHLIQEKKKSRILQQQNEKYKRYRLHNEQKLKKENNKNVILTKENKTLIVQMETLQTAYDELTERYIGKQRKISQMNVEYKTLDEEYLILLEKEKRKTLDDASNNSNYKNWSYKDIVYWISYLDAARFEKYEKLFIENMRKENIKGCHLRDLDKHDIHRFGCTNYEDKKALLSHFQSLGQ